MEGEGFFDSLIRGRDNGYRPSIRKLLKEQAGKTIKTAMLGRTPVRSIVTGAFNVLSLGKFEKNNPYDKLFHLFLIIDLEDGVKIRVEKNEIITIQRDITGTYKPQTEFHKIEIHTHPTLNVRLDLTQQRMNAKYLLYDAKSNNCQDFIVHVMMANQFGDIDDFTFVKQNTRQLFKYLGMLHKFQKGGIGFARSANVLMEGEGMKYKHKIMKESPFKKAYSAYKKKNKSDIEIEDFALLVHHHPADFKLAVVKKARVFLHTAQPFGQIARAGTKYAVPALATTAGFAIGGPGGAAAGTMLGNVAADELVKARLRIKERKIY